MLEAADVAVRIGEHGVLNVGAGDTKQLSLREGMIGPHNDRGRAIAHASILLAAADELLRTRSGRAQWPLLLWTKRSRMSRA